MSSRKRAAHDADGSPTTCSKPRFECINIDVGGTCFKTSVSTLTAASAYFQRLLSERWAEERPTDLFLDRDPEPFGILLSFMRTGHLKLPEDNAALAGSILLEAEYLGIDSVLQLVKARAHRNWHADWSGDDRAAVAAFSEENGDTLSAVSSGVLPYRYFTSKRDDKKRKVVQLLPAPPGCMVTIKYGGRNETIETLPVHCLALVENRRQIRSGDRFGADVLDAIVTHPYVAGQSLASEVFNDTAWFRLWTDEMKNVFKVPDGQLAAEYWKDENDHSRGTTSHSVNLVRTVCDRHGKAYLEAVDLKPFARDDDDDDDDDGSPQDRIGLTGVSTWSNFKGFVV
jgi:hypothetical protein